MPGSWAFEQLNKGLRFSKQSKVFCDTTKTEVPKFPSFWHVVRESFLLQLMFHTSVTELAKAILTPTLDSFSYIKCNAWFHTQKSIGHTIIKHSIWVYAYVCMHTHRVSSPINVCSILKRYLSGSIQIVIIYYFHTFFFWITLQSLVSYHQLSQVICI